MSTGTRPASTRRPGSQNQRPSRKRPWWHYLIVSTIVLALGGIAWGGYATWFALAHVRTVKARVTGLVVNVAAKDDTRVQKVLVRTGDEVAEGQVVVLLDRAGLEANLEEAQAQVAAQQSALLRAEKELEITIRQTAATMQEAEAQLAAARARLAQAEAEKELRTRQQPDEVRHAEADLASANSELDAAAATLRRMETLHDQGAVSQRGLDTARTDYQVAEAAVAAADAALAVAKARDYEGTIRSQQVATRAAEEQRAIAGLESAHATGRMIALLEQEVLSKHAAVSAAEAGVGAAEARLSDAVLRSPISGVVVRGPGYSIKDGEVVVKGMPIVTVVSTEVPLWLSASVSELYVDRIRAGQPALIRIDAFRRRWFHGEVEKVGRATEFASEQSSPWMIQEVPLKLTFDPQGMDVRHGMTCRVWIDYRKR